MHKRCKGQTHLLLMINDITDRKLAEQTLREREPALEIRSHELEEVNTGLKVLVKRREAHKTW